MPTICICDWTDNVSSGLLNQSGQREMREREMREREMRERGVGEMERVRENENEEPDSRACS